MRIRSCSFLLAAAVVVHSLAAVAQNESVAMITGVTGRATVTTPGAPAVDAAIGADLRPGASVRVTDGTASIVFLQGDFIELKAGETLTLSASLATSTLDNGDGTRGTPRPDALLAADGGVARKALTGRFRQLATVSGIRGDMTPVAISPRLLIADPEQTFCWYDPDTTSTAQRTYTIIVRDQDQKTLLEREADGMPGRLNTARIDGLAALLRIAPERHYTWGVFARGSDAPARGALDAPFVIADRDGVQRAAERRTGLSALVNGKKLDPSSYHMLSVLACIDDRERLFGDAMPHLLALAATPAGRAFAQDALADIFSRFGNQVAAVAHAAIASTGGR